MTPAAPHSERHERPVRSFVLREGRLTRAQRRALEALWPRYGVEPDGTLDLHALFGRDAPVWLEIGFGDGDALRHMARAHPEVDFLGIEMHRPGIGRLLNGLADDGLDNVRVIRADAADVLRTHVADGALARVLILFPDPWPKKRHHKRRLVQAPFVAELARVLAPGGVLHLATDWQDYAEHVRAVLAANEAFVAADTAPLRPPPYRPRTRFEARGEARGHEVHDLHYRRP